ncbi:MAG: divalent metal cation transporter [Gemmatimonadetes bacterium]|nr:divalent metal cation transporter [Gemmatimonadota bacterium]
MYWISKLIHQFSRLKRRWLVLFAVLGPGIITMVADNDAGGISTYAQTGARTGFNMLWAFLLLVPMAYFVQEMTVRLGAVTKRGHAEAIFDGFGPVWGWFSVFDLVLINWLTLVTEYIGMTQALRLFNIPEWVTFGGVTALLMAIVITGKYWTFEKITLVFCLFNMVYIPAAFWAMHTGNVAGGWTAVGRGFYAPHFTLNDALTPAALMTLVMANIGTTITPWQIFFQQSAVVDKGMDIKDIAFGKIDTLFGALLTCIVAAFIIIATAAMFHHNPSGPIDIESAALAAARMPEVLPGEHLGVYAKGLFAIGLFDAGLLGALCISLSTSWALGEVFGWAHSLNRSVREAPWFYVAYLLMLLSAGVVSLVAGAQLQDAITIFVQVVAVTLLPAALVFLILLLNDKALMGEHVNTRTQNVANWAITILVIVVSSAFGISVLFPSFFGAGAN